MTTYYLKVNNCDNRHCLTGLTKSNGNPAPFRSISLAPTTGPISGHASGEAVTIYVKQIDIDTIHNRVNDQNPNRDVRVLFDVSRQSTVSTFSHEYT